MSQIPVKFILSNGALVVEGLVDGKTTMEDLKTIKDRAAKGEPCTVQINGDCHVEQDTFLTRLQSEARDTGVLFKVNGEIAQPNTPIAGRVTSVREAKSGDAGNNPDPTAEPITAEVIEEEEPERDDAIPAPPSEAGGEA